MSDSLQWVEATEVTRQQIRMFLVRHSVVSTMLNAPRRCVVLELLLYWADVLLVLVHNALLLLVDIVLLRPRR